MNIPADLRYTEHDEWVRVDGTTATIGITDYAQDALSDIVYVEINFNTGESGAQGDTFGSVESVKAASDVYMPISGEIIEVNDLLEETPEVINSDPYGKAWMIKLTLSDAAELDNLMDAAAYEAFLGSRD